MPVHTVFTEYLNTNYVPSELEVPLLERIVVEYKTKANALAFEIEQAERAMSPLKDQRAACLKMMEEHLALLSCARTIPIEILQLIFQECTPGTESGPPGITSPLHPSNSLSRVCRSWRSAALGRPELWSGLCIVLPRHTPGEHCQCVRKMGKLVKAVDVWLDRASSSPLTVLVESGVSSECPLDAEEHSDMYSTLVQTIKQSAARWTNLTLRITIKHKLHNSTSLLDLMQLTSTSLPLLEVAYLKVSAPSATGDQLLQQHLQQLMKTSGLFSTPTLHSLTLRGAWGDTCVPALMNPWPALTSLHVDYDVPDTTVSSTIGAFQLISHLQAIPSLLDVSFFIQGRSASNSQMPVVESEPPLEIPNLQSLKLMGARVPRKFGSFVSFPALHTLHLRFQDGRPENVESGLVGCILSSSAHLKLLTFSPHSVDREALAKIFQNLPCVETLMLDAQGLECSSVKPTVDFYAITELNVEETEFVGVGGGTATSEVPLRCPQLRLLGLKTTRKRYEDDNVEKALVEFIVKRRGRLWGGGYRLDEVSVAFGQEQGRRTPGILQKLKERGANLNGFILRL